MNDTKSKANDELTEKQLKDLVLFFYTKLPSHLVIDIQQVLTVMTAIDIDNGVLITAAGDEDTSQKLEPGNYIILRVAHLPVNDVVKGLTEYPLVESHANG